MLLFGDQRLISSMDDAGDLHKRDIGSRSDESEHGLYGADVHFLR